MISEKYGPVIVKERSFSMMKTKMKGRILAILMSLAMVFVMIPMTAWMVYAADSISAECDEGFIVWIANPDQRTASISRRADTNTNTEINIPSSVTCNGVTYTVTGIEGSSFANTNITKLTVPDGVTSIGPSAFSGCTYLAEITLPDSITDINRSSFEGTAYYNNPKNWENGVLYIGKCLIAGKPEVNKCNVIAGTVTIADSAFDNNHSSSLTEVYIPASVVRIGSRAFSNCSALKTVSFTVDSRLKTIGVTAFAACSSLSSISIPDSVNEIGNDAFIKTGLTRIVLPEGLTCIRAYTFTDCSSLKEVTIPSTVTEIHDFAFDKCPLETIHFGGSPSQWDAITGYGKPSITPKDYVNVDVEVTFDAAGGTWPDGTTEDKKVPVAKGSAATAPEVPMKDGYTFDGWDTELNNVITDLTVKAKWKENTPPVETFTVTFVDGQGNTLKTETVGRGQSATAPADPAREGYTFDGWDKDFSNVTSDLTVTAKWKEQISIQNAEVVLSAASFTYDGEVHKPSVETIGGNTLTEGTDYTVEWSNESSKDVGSYTVTITGEGNCTGTATAKYKINPKGTTLKSPKKASKAVTVKWKKQSGKMSKSRISGYQIQLATDKKFTKNKKTVNVKGYKNTSRKVTKLKGGKKYYVRIRTYKAVGGTKCYSPWSGVRTVTTKK